MKRLSKVHKADEKYVRVDADANFDPEHNMRVVEGVIKQNEENRKRIEREFKEATDERVDDLTLYLKGIDQGGRDSNIDQYFGRKRMAYLRGEQIVSKMRENLTIRNSMGKIVKRAGES